MSFRQVHHINGETEDCSESYIVAEHVNPRSRLNYNVYIPLVRVVTVLLLSQNQHMDLHNLRLTHFQNSRQLYIQAIFLLCLTLFHILANTSFSDSESDRIALLAIKSNIKHDPQGVVSSWNDSAQFCEWRGVICSRRHKRVTILDLGSRGLVGSLSPYLGNLSFVRKIFLYNNTIQGQIPHEVGSLFRLQVLSLNNNSLEGEIPANLSRCSNLIFLGVAYNKLVGKIPMELGSLSRLIELNIHYNSLMGGIPLSVGNLTSLESLSLADNVLGGSIPDALGRVKSLTFLGLGGNNFSGTIPPSLYNLSSITTFSMSFNQLHGSISPDIALTLPHLQWLQMNMNQFTGPIPISLSNASKAEHISLDYNYFTEKVYNNFGGLRHLRRLTLAYNNLGSGEADDLSFLDSMVNCSSLEILHLHGNQFGGVLLSSVGNLSTQLRRLGLAGNQINGGIPSRIGNLVNLNMLDLGSNQFTGTIPIDIGKLQKLRGLYFSFNRLSGKIPSALGNLSLLTELYSQNNSLQGAIPSSLGNCQNLLLLDFSHNNLSGTIPEQLFSISTLSISLNLARNHFVGSLPSNIGNLGNLAKLDVSENKLSGQLPSSIGGCASLEYLYMEGNFFQGSIPPSLSSLRGIRNLDLSRNNFTGQIPNYLENFSLNNLNLSFNDFEGEVPMEGVFTKGSAISVVGNNRLCGGISELQLPRCTMKESKKRKMSLLLVLIISIACALVGVTVVSSFLFFWFKKKRKDQSSGSLLGESFVKVSYGKLLKATDGFSSANLIGIGSFGSVYKGFLDQVETIVAVKVLNPQHRGATKSFKAECEALRNIRHRNLLKIITSCSSIDFHGNDFKALVYELMPNGSLERWLHSIPEIDDEQDERQNLNLLQRINIAIDVACALNYLHHHCQNPIVHCDLKPSNVLLDSDMTAHVGDFGLAKFLPELTYLNQSSSVGIRGTIGYVAPEYGLGSEVSTNGDVYSYGILLLEMMTGKRPTDPMFKEGLNLHNFARTSLPDRVMQIVDPILLNHNVETAANNNRNSTRARNEGRMEECLICMVKIGVACSIESPEDRMDMGNVLSELHLVRDILPGTCNRGLHA